MRRRRHEACISIASPRAGNWLRVLGTDSVPLVTATSFRACDESGDVREFYLVDFSALTKRQQERLVDHVCKTSDVGPELVRELIVEQHGFPVPAEDLVLRPDRWRVN